MSNLPPSGPPPGPARPGAPASPQAGALLNLPNLISLARLTAVPFAVGFVLHQAFAAAFGVFVLAGLSDALDGWLARRRGTTTLGAVLDPLADKALMVAMYVTLAVTGHLPDWLAILVVFRDALIVGGVMLLTLFHQPPVIAPLAISRTNTALQIVLIGAVLGTRALGVAWPALISSLVALVALSTIASGTAYVAAGLRAADRPGELRGPIDE